MGLDLYAGPLCRYYGGEWETVTQQWGREHGVPVKIVRPDDEASAGSWWRRLLGRLLRKPAPSQPEDPLPKIEAWRAELSGSGRFGDADFWQWPESFDEAYETDKPDWDGLVALQMWAAYAEQPSRSRPSGSEPDNRDPALKAALSLGPGAVFHQIYEPEIWVPVRFSPPATGPLPTGGSAMIGSVPLLLDQLREINRRTWGAADDQIDAWREREIDPGDFESVAPWAFSIVYRLTVFAAERRLPMILDY